MSMTFCTYHLRNFMAATYLTADDVAAELRKVDDALHYEAATIRDMLRHDDTTLPACITKLIVGMAMCKLDRHMVLSRAVQVLTSGTEGDRVLPVIAETLQAMAQAQVRLVEDHRPSNYSGAHRPFDIRSYFYRPDDYKGFAPLQS